MVDDAAAFYFEFVLVEIYVAIWVVSLLPKLSIWSTRIGVDDAAIGVDGAANCDVHPWRYSIRRGPNAKPISVPGGSGGGSLEARRMPDHCSCDFGGVGLCCIYSSRLAFN